MVSREEKHLHNDRLCYKCDTLQESKDDLIVYHMSGRGYGSFFDNESFEIQLCNNCAKPEYQKWFDEIPTYDEFLERYKYEDKIQELINSFPIENQEYVLNGADGWAMERDHWIAMKKGTLKDEIYEEYGLYSPRQIKAYEERFPTCEHPVNVIYEDGSKNCYCPFGAYGKFDQNIKEHSYSTECFGCEFYKKRETPLKTMDNDTYNKYERYIKGKVYVEKYKDLFE
ncbi:hypothetical protein [Bacillus smithii]|uniref:hypothetical protein n=1 Tax=Bacillus smithii TaxID=1479 RepID=UPI003D191AB5